MTLNLPTLKKSRFYHDKHKKLLLEAEYLLHEDNKNKLAEVEEQFLIINLKNEYSQRKKLLFVYLPIIAHN